MFQILLNVVVITCSVYDSQEFVGGDIGIHVSDVKGGESQVVVVWDVCEVVDELGGSS
jgi:hypothetical protein